MATDSASSSGPLRSSASSAASVRAPSQRLTASTELPPPSAGRSNSSRLGTRPPTPNGRRFYESALDDYDDDHLSASGIATPGTGAVTPFGFPGLPGLGTPGAQLPSGAATPRGRPESRLAKGFTALRSRLPSPAYALENSGSVARDHLANERTWLAYLRTSLAIASTGVALVQLFTISASSEYKPGNDSLLARLFPPPSSPSPSISANVLDASNGVLEALADPSRTRIQRFARPLGGITVALAIFVLGIGAYRYFRIQRALMGGRFPPARRSMALISGLLLSIVIVVFGVLVGVRQE